MVFGPEDPLGIALGLYANAGVLRLKSTVARPKLKEIRGPRWELRNVAI